jgi:hypothetical protein
MNARFPKGYEWLEDIRSDELDAFRQYVNGNRTGEVTFAEAAEDHARKKAKENPCHKCGGPMISEEQIKAGVDDIYGAIVEFATGYFSTDFADGVHFRFRLCEACLFDLMKGFKIPGEVEDCLFSVRCWEDLVREE